MKVGNNKDFDQLREEMVVFLEDDVGLGHFVWVNKIVLNDAIGDEDQDENWNKASFLKHLIFQPDFRRVS